LLRIVTCTTACVGPASFKIGCPIGTGGALRLGGPYKASTAIGWGTVDPTRFPAVAASFGNEDVGAGMMSALDKNVPSNASNSCAPSLCRYWNASDRV